ncbi:nucleoid-associated protein YejK [Vibrio owensii]|uniref:nucleoid-associated protein YejK n=1 Tax=Vibrio owensii TaxID=696485 RepID=UPI0018F16652|nr:nucleoid-associated protein YejK [Vibrio owensii]
MFELKNAVIHELELDESSEISLKLRNEPLNNNVITEALVTEIHRVYRNKTGISKGYGRFKEESQFRNSVVDLYNQTTRFIDFSTNSSIALKEQISRYPFADAGAIVIAEYTALATDYLFIGIIPFDNSFHLNQELAPNAIEHLDINKMDIAACIDLSTFSTTGENNRYVSFIKGRVGRRISDFFLDFMEVELGLDPKEQNTILTQAISDYCSSNNFTKDEAHSTKQMVRTYCNDALKGGEEALVAELSAELPLGENGETFNAYVAREGYDLADQFPVDRSAIRKLTKFAGAGGGLNITFDAILLDERVHYDPETDTLTIKGTPPNLRSQLTSSPKHKSKA